MGTLAVVVQPAKVTTGVSTATANVPSTVKMNGIVAQLVAQLTLNEKVVGSYPTNPTNRGRSSMVEHRPFKAVVVGSCPTGLTIRKNNMCQGSQVVQGAAPITQRSCVQSTPLVPTPRWLSGHSSALITRRSQVRILPSGPELHVEM